jgi:His-Xaa-Ser system protein HxsD
MTGGLDHRADAAPPVRAHDDGVAIDIDRDLFSTDAILKSSYKFTDRCHVFIHKHETREDCWTVVIKPKTVDVSTLEVVGDFSNELIDQRLRERLEQQFGDVRTLIVAQAFAEGNLLDAERADGDYETDPNGIGRLRP